MRASSSEPKRSEFKDAIGIASVPAVLRVGGGAIQSRDSRTERARTPIRPAIVLHNRSGHGIHVIAKKLDDNTLYNADAELEWKCVNCGYIHKGKAPPQTCPVCKKPQTWYMPLGLVR